jgi:HEAT repeat protein
VAVPFAVSARLLADVVELRNGQAIEGRVRLLGDQAEVITAGGDKVTLRRAEIVRIRATNSKGGPDVRITEPLRERVALHRRLESLARALEAGGPDALPAARELVRAGPEGLPALKAALGSRDEATVQLAIRALGTIGARPATEELARMLPSLKPALQVDVLACLGRVRAVHAEPAIAELLRADRTPPAVRLAAVKALGQLRSDLAIPALLRSLGQPATSAAAADALVELDAPQAVAYLNRLVQKRAPSARLAARVAARIIRPDQVPLLVEFLQSEQPGVQAAGRAGLERLKSSRADRVAAYVGLLASRSKEERRAAAAQLERLSGRGEANADAWRRWWLEQNRSRARVALVPLGRAEAAAKGVRADLEKATDLRAIVAPAVAVSPWSRLPGSDRFRAEALLDQLDDWMRANPNVIVAIGVTPAAVEQPGRGAVMGAWRHGRCGLVSLPALAAADKAELRRRLRRYALHVLARSLRIDRADEATCPASAVFEPGGVDHLSDTYSDPTAELIGHSVRASVARLAGFLHTAVQELGQLNKHAPAFDHAGEAARVFERDADLAWARRRWESALKAAPDPVARAMCRARIDLINALADPK